MIVLLILYEGQYTLLFFWLTIVKIQLLIFIEIKIFLCQKLLKRKIKTIYYNSSILSYLFYNVCHLVKFDYYFFYSVCSGFNHAWNLTIKRKLYKYSTCRYLKTTNITTLWTRYLTADGSWTFQKFNPLSPSLNYN